MGEIPVVEYHCETCGSWMSSTLHPEGSASGLKCCGRPMVLRAPGAVTVAEHAVTVAELPGKVG